MEMVSKHLVVMYIDLADDLTSIGCFHFTTPLWASTVVAWYVFLNRTYSAYSFILILYVTFD